jgi:glycosyltransferase involved in cell wall biosynthesis
MPSNRSVVFVFNLELNLESEVLAVAHDWVEEFATIASKVYVFSTHIGSISLPENVKVVEIGGGSLLKKIIGLLRLFQQIPLIYELRRDLVVFHHMSPRTVLILGPIFRILGIPQGLWYSHSHKSLELVISSRIVNRLFSSTKQAIPLESKKSKFVGHGIPINKFIKWRDSNDKRSMQMVSVGRLASIKKYEHGISLANKLPGSKNSFLIIGPGDQDSEYPVALRELAAALGVDLFFSGPRNYQEIPDLMADTKYFFSGTPKSVDKAVIEAALSGAFVLSENKNAMHLGGMQSLIKSWGRDNDPSLEEIVGIIEGFTAGELQDARRRVSLEAERLSNLNNTCRAILSCLQER